MALAEKDVSRLYLGELTPYTYVTHHSHQLAKTCEWYNIIAGFDVFPPKGVEGCSPGPFPGLLSFDVVIWLFDLVKFVLFSPPFPVSFGGNTGRG